MALRNVYSYHTGAGGLLTRRGTTPQSPTTPGTGGGTAAPITLLDVTFDDWALGSPTTTYWNARMGGGGVSGQLARHDVIVNPDGAGKVMQLTLLAGIQGSGGSTAMFVPLKQTVDDVTVEYRFKLVGAYDYGLGQKLPGPSGVRPGITAGFPTGGNTVVDEGYSVRAMQATHSGRPDGTGLTYVYGSDVAAAYGQDLWWDVVLPKNTWLTIKHRVKLNTVSPSVLYDGIIQTDFQGLREVDQSNRQLRVRGDVHTTHFLWHWFYGGADATWAPTTDQRILIDWVKITGVA